MLSLPPAEETVTEETVAEEPVAEEVPVEEEQPEPEETVEQTEAEAAQAEEAPVEKEQPIAEEVAEQTEETTAEEPVAEEPAVEEVTAVEQPEKPAEKQTESEATATEIAATTAATTEAPATEAESPAEEAPKKDVFKLTVPENNDELMALMCAKRGRKLIYAPKEVLYEHTFTVLGTDKKNDEGIKVKDIIDAEIKAGEKIGYLQKYDGLKTSEIKEEYENDVVYEYADQEFKKAGVIYDGKKIKVYLYDWDGKAVHHVGYIDEVEGADAIKYFTDKENYSFGLNAIITGGKGKRVIKDEKGKITIEKIKDGVVGLELDVNVIKRKD